MKRQIDSSVADLSLPLANQDCPALGSLELAECLEGGTAERIIVRHNSIQWATSLDTLDLGCWRSSKLVGAMTMLVKLAVSDHSEITAIFEVDESEIPGEMVLAATPDPGKATEVATVSLDDALARAEPTLRHIADRLRAMSPDEISLEFGLKVGGEAGVIFAKGTAEVNFVVRLAWRATP